MKLKIQDYKLLQEQLGEDFEKISLSFWADKILKKYYGDDSPLSDKEDIRWLMLLAYQRGYAKAVEDGGIPDYDEYDESEAFAEDWENHDDND